MAEKNDVAKEVASIMAGGRFNRVSCHFEFKQPRVFGCAFHIIPHHSVIFLFTRCILKRYAMPEDLDRPRSQSVIAPLIFCCCC